MKWLSVVLLVCVFCYTKSDHLIVGNVGDRVVLAHDEKVQYNAFPFIIRDKYYFYPGEHNKLIAGIRAIDTLLTKASINVTAGGVGHSFANFHMKSERGYGLDYDIAIYVKPEY